MENFTLNYKTGSYEMIPLTVEQLNDRLAGWRGQSGKVVMNVRIAKLPDINMYRVWIERSKQLGEFSNSWSTVFIWTCDVLWAREDLDPLMMEMYEPMSGKKMRYGKKWFRAQDIINQVFKYVERVKED